MHRLQTTLQFHRLFLLPLQTNNSRRLIIAMADSSSSPATADSLALKQELASSPAAADAVAVDLEADVDSKFGFSRAEMGSAQLAGTVNFHERHVFLCYKGPDVWPSHVEASESDRLPRLLSAAIASRKADMKKRTRLTICEGEDGTDSSNGDVLIFPDMIRYRRLTHFDVDTFVEEVLVKDTEWAHGAAETITGSYIFVCAHGSRDRRCGVCGPALIEKFKDEISARSLDGQISVSACSHIGGHKYAGNIIIFSADINGEVTGHWYGYVTPDHVPTLLDEHIGKGEIVDHLWRGQMGLAEEQQKKALELRHLMNGEMDKNLSSKEFPQESGADGPAINPANGGGCCQGNGGVTCCQNEPQKEKERSLVDEKNLVSSEKNKNGSTSSSKKGQKKISPMPTWFETWEKEDTYAALAVVAAAASAFVAFSLYKQRK